MGTFLKYAFYLALIFIVYLFFAGFYEGTITKNSTVEEVGSEVSDNAKRIISDTYNKTKDEISTEEKDKTEAKK